MRYADDMTSRYSPLYFLAALGAGGLAVSFFMYLLWLTPHPTSAIPTYASLVTAWPHAGPAVQAMIAVSVAGIALFATLHVRLLVWNFGHYRAWASTPAADTLRRSNAETQLLALPLTLAMTVNVGFIVGAVFVPGLWDVRELLFPAALAAFLAIGVWAMRQFLAFIGRVLSDGGFDCAKNNSLGQMLAVFAFAMVGVGFSAPAAMSHVKLVAAIGFAGAVFFTTAAVVLGLIFLVLGFRAMFEHSAAHETTPTLWIMIPILTVIGIAIYRLKMALAHTFETPVTTGEVFAFLLVILAMQILFGLIGWVVMRRVRYFETFVDGPAQSPGAYALVCPGVALTVSAHFLVHAALVKLGLVDLMSPGHLALLLPIVLLQIATIALFFKLNAKLLRPMPSLRTIAAE